MSSPAATQQPDEKQDSEPQKKVEEPATVDTVRKTLEVEKGKSAQQALVIGHDATETRQAGQDAGTANMDEEHQNGAPQDSVSLPRATASVAIDAVTVESLPAIESTSTNLTLAEPGPAAGKLPEQSSPPPPPPKDEKFLSTNNAPSRSTSPLSHTKSSGRNSEDNAMAQFTSKFDGHDEAGEDSIEIQNIMEQFDSSNNPGTEDIVSPHPGLASSYLETSSPKFPIRRSSLAPRGKPLPTPTDEETPESPSLLSVSPQSPSLHHISVKKSFAEPASPSAHVTKYQPVQPAPEPDPDLPFDFHRFLEQLRHRTADPVAKFLRSFLLEFGKKQWMVHEQVKIIADFLEFISKKMALCEVWRLVSDAEFDNAREGMEKLVMNRLYAQTFSPAIPAPRPTSPRKGRRRQDLSGPNRRGQHQEDVERDGVLAQKVRIYKWVKEDHLDIKPIGEKGRKFLQLAQQELLKIKSYRAPRDKIICILNCCKVIFGFLRTSSSDQSADAFIPLLIYTVLQANPDHLVSNVQYILRFRNQEKLGGEAGYYISSLMGAVQFIEGLDKTSLTVSDEEFDRNVEAAVSAIAERPPTQESESSLSHAQFQSVASDYLNAPEKVAPLQPELMQRSSLERERAEPRQSMDQVGPKLEGSQSEEEHIAVAGLLRTIKKPLSMVGRMFSDSDTSANSGSASAPQPGDTSRTTSSVPLRSSAETLARRSGSSDEPERRRQRLSAEDAAARQASAEAEQAKKIQQQEHKIVVETMSGMFPQLDRDIIDDVVRQKEGRVGPAVDALLILANP